MQRILLSCSLALVLTACSSSSGEVSGSLLFGESNATTTLREDKPAALHFWTDDCKACLNDVEILLSTQKEFPEFALISVYVGDDVSAARASWRSIGEPFPLLVDKQNALWQGYQVTILPTTLFVNAEGLVISRVDGPLDAALAPMRMLEIQQM